MITKMTLSPGMARASSPVRDLETCPPTAHRLRALHLLILSMLGLPLPAMAADLHQASELAGEGGTGAIASRAEVEQYGLGNDAYVGQSGALHGATTLQSGIRNSASVFQAGQGHDARILQSGGYLEGTILQYGYGHEATLVQQGVGKEAGIIQEGVRGQVDVIQLNASRGTPVEVRQFSRGQAAIQVIQH